MFYMCGSIGDYEYVYDSDDGSCELIPDSKISQIQVLSGVVNPHMNLAKLRMLYGFKPDSDCLCLYLCNYFIDFFGFGVRIFLRVYLLSSDNIYHYYGNIDELHGFCFGSDNKYFLFLSFIQYDVFEERFDSLEFIQRKLMMKNDMEFRGIPFPLHMMNYMMSFVKKHDFIGLDSAFGGALFRGLKLRSNDGIWINRHGVLNERNIAWKC